MESYASPGPTREDIDQMTGAVVLELGTDWCGFCSEAAPRFAAVLDEHAGVRHIRVEDGSGRKLGRSFGVKLWPTFVFLRDGREVARLVRPRDEDAIRAAFARL
jgi:thioredoxin 1